MENKMYRTKDLGEAAALITMQVPLIEMDRQGYICWFVFSEPAQCQKISSQFFFGNLQVNARDFFEAMTRLKSQIFNR